MQTGWLSRLWALPLGWHVVALAMVLLLGLWVSEPGTAWSSDEGAALIQVHLLAEGDWSYRYPLADLTPGAEAEAGPFHRGDATQLGRAPFAKHPAYPLLLLPFRWALGNGGYAFPSVLGTLVAAWGAARITDLIARRGERATLWLVGLASPLLFDSYIAIGHTLAAAGAAIALLAVLRVVGGRGSPVFGALIAMGGCAFAVLVRAEAVFIGLGLMVALVSMAWFGGAPRRRSAWATVGVLIGTGGAFVLEWLMRRVIVGGAPRGTVPQTHGRWLAGRFEGVVSTWLDPSYTAGPEADVAMVVALLAVVIAFVAIRERRVDVARVALVVAATGYLLRVLLAPPGTVPGLLMACPWILAVGLLHRSDLAGVGARIVALSSAVAVAGILLTQHARGGGQEWGGRYFAVVIPLLAPLVVLAVQGTLDRFGHARVLDPIIVGALAVVAASLVFLGFEEVRSKHHGAERVAEMMAELAADHPEVARIAADPIVFAPGGEFVPQIIWPEFDNYVWVSPVLTQGATYADALARMNREPVIGFTSLEETWSEMGWEVVDQRHDGNLVVVVAQPEGD